MLFKEEWISKLWYVNTMEHYKEINLDGSQMHCPELREDWLRRLFTMIHWHLHDIVEKATL